MIESSCRCGLALQAPESQIGKEDVCPSCGCLLHYVCAEALDDGAGAGDFDRALTVKAGPGRAGEELFLGGVAPIEVGRVPEVTLQLPGHLVSRHHCTFTRLDFGPSRWTIEDHGSHNGLWVNGKRVKSQELQVGDELKIGEYELVVRDATPR